MPSVPSASAISPIYSCRGASRIGSAPCLLVLTSTAFAQEEDKELPLPETKCTPAAPDSLLPQIKAAIQGVTAPAAVTLANALGIGGKPGDAATGAPPNTLAPTGDLDGDGVPEMVLKWLFPDDAAGAEAAPAPDSSPSGVFTFFPGTARTGRPRALSRGRGL